MEISSRILLSYIQHHQHFFRHSNSPENCPEGCVRSRRLSPQVSLNLAEQPLARTQDEWYIDDRESLDPEQLQKNGVQRFFSKLSRYHTACHTVVRERVVLSESR